MPQIDFVIADTPDGGVSLRTSFSPAIGAPCSPAQHLALEVIALHHRQTILKPTCAGAGAGAGAVAIPRNPLPRLYHHYQLRWESLGYPAFIAMAGTYYLMVNKPALWA